eukprot:83409-Chlamydomonas_euryale.AAC.1
MGAPTDELRGCGVRTPNVWRPSPTAGGGPSAHVRTTENVWRLGHAAPPAGRPGGRKRHGGRWPMPRASNVLDRRWEEGTGGMREGGGASAMSAAPVRTPESRARGDGDGPCGRQQPALAVHATHRSTALVSFSSKPRPGTLSCR